MPEFLSDEWLSAFDAAVNAHEDRLEALDGFIVEQVVTDVPQQGEVRYRITFASGRARVSRTGADEPEPHVRITTDYDAAVALAQGRTNAQRVLAAGRLRIGGDVAALASRADILTALEDRGAVLRTTTTYPSAERTSVE